MYSAQPLTQSALAYGLASWTLPQGESERISITYSSFIHNPGIDRYKQAASYKGHLALGTAVMGLEP